MVFRGLEGLEARITPAAAHPIVDLADPNSGNFEELPAGEVFERGGDFNGDGFADWFYGESFWGSQGKANGWVIFGDGSDTRPVLDLGSLDGTNGFKIITGRPTLSFSGTADVNGDGLDDLVLLSRQYSVYSSNSSDDLVVIPGSQDGFAPVIDLSAEGQGGALVIKYLQNASVSFLGDVNGDGADDLAVVSGSRGDAGWLTDQTAFIFWGSSDDSVSALEKSTEIRRDWGKFNESFDRIAINGIGDFNGDGIDDFAVGLSVTDRESMATELFTSVFFGSSQPLGSEILLSGESMPSAPLVFHDTGGIAISSTGNTVKVVPVGDTNGDGFDDFVVSGTGVGSRANAVGTLILGSGSAESLPPATVELTGRGFGGAVSISGAGDVNGDGLADIAISGASRHGTLNVLFGAETLSDRIRVDGLSGLSGFEILYSQNRTVSFFEAGDFNGDGIGDLKVLVTQVTASASQHVIVFGAADVATPQVTFKNDRTATFTDQNGDLVTIKVNKGSLSQQNFLLVAEGEGYRLAQLNLSDPQFEGASVKITAKASKTAGDGFTVVDSIFAGDVDLKTVSVAGHLGSIVAGDQDLSRPGLVTLKVGSLGGHESVIAESLFTGGITTLRVDGSVENARVQSMNAGFGSIRIGDSLIDSIIAATESSLAGEKRAGIKKMLVGDDVYGSQIMTGGQGENIGSVKVGGDWGGSNLLAGQPLSHNFSGAANYFDSEPWELVNATIGKIQIGGILTGDATPGIYSGFRATSIDGLKVGSFNVIIEDDATLPSLTPTVKLQLA